MTKQLPRKHVKDIPDIVPKVLQGKYRHDVIDLLSMQDSAVGVELGVAEGIFSERMINSRRFSHFYGIDAYSDMHNTDQYKRALKRVGIESNYKLLRMRFDEAYDLFDDDYFDFIYVDGYAHSGEEGGQTIFSWYRKLKIGGVIAGDDYHPDWPLVIWAVHELARQTDSPLLVTELVEKDTPYCEYPSWAIIKTAHREGFSSPLPLIKLAEKESERRLRNYRLNLIVKKPIKNFVRRLWRREGNKT